MINTIILIAIAILFIYTAIFTLYFVIIVAASNLKIANKYNDDIEREKKNIVVVIYSHNNERTIVNLLEQLKKQDYPTNKYQIHIILDNCTDNSSNKLEFVGGAKLWRLTDDTPFGRDKAISWLLENLMSFSKIDSYVFLNANRMVRSDFLSRINESLQTNPVIVGSTEIILENPDFYDRVWASVNKYNTNIMKLGRSKLGLAIPIDSDITAINHEVLEKVRCIDFKDANAELKYSFLLTSVNLVPKFEPKVKTYVSSLDYELRRPDFGYKLSLLFNCINSKSILNIKFMEFLFSLLKPNPILLVMSIILIGFYSFNYYFFLDFPWAIIMACILAISFGYSIYRTNLYVKSIIYLISCPIYTLIDTLSKIKIFKKLFSFSLKKKRTPEVEKITVPVCVTNGRAAFACTLDLISEEGFKKVIFRYKNKKQETNQSYVRMCDAVKNISDILEQHGFRMKICQSCGYFSPKIDGSNNMVKGYCNKIAVEETDPANLPETLLWSSCEDYIPEEVNNVINIADFIRNK